MKSLTKKKLSSQLSLYLDGRLSESERSELEAYLADHPEATKELDELRILQRLLRERKKLKENPSFWVQLSSALEGQRAERENFLPFPRRFVPVAAALGLLLALAGGVMLFQKRQEVGQFLSEKSTLVHNAYEKSVLKGSILPLFSNLDKNEVLSFAMFGSLPLDTKSETTLEIDDRSEKGYRIELSKRSSARKTVTMRDLERDVKLTSDQTKAIDSMLALMKNRIEASVLITENDALVIDPELPKLNREVVTNIAAILEPHQRDRFDKFLQAREGRYSVKFRHAPPVRPEEVFGRLHNQKRSENFVIVTPDTVILSEVQIDVDSIRQHFIHRMPPMMGRAERAIRRLAEREARSLPRFQVIPRSLQVYGDSDAFSIEIDRELTDTETSPVKVEVRSLPPARRRAPFPRPQGFGFRFYIPMNPEGVDSLMVRVLEQQKSFDSAFFYSQDQFQRHYAPKLDSLLRVMEQKRLEQVRRKARVEQE